jgi:hypothetical protein
MPNVSTCCLWYNHLSTTETTPEKTRVTRYMILFFFLLCAKSELLKPDILHAGLQQMTVLRTVSSKSNGISALLQAFRDPGRRPADQQSLYVPRAAALPTPANCHIFSSSLLGVLFIGVLVVLTSTGFSTLGTSSLG